MSPGWRQIGYGLAPWPPDSAAGPTVGSRGKTCAHGESMVAERGRLPGLSALIRRFERRWARRLGGDQRTPRPSAMAWCRRAVDIALLPVADARRGIRRYGLLRCRSAIRHS